MITKFQIFESKKQEFLENLKWNMMKDDVSFDKFIEYIEINKDKYDKYNPTPRKLLIKDITIDIFKTMLCGNFFKLNDLLLSKIVYLIEKCSNFIKDEIIDIFLRYIKDSIFLYKLREDDTSDNFHKNIILYLMKKFTIFSDAINNLSIFFDVDKYFKNYDFKIKVKIDIDFIKFLLNSEEIKSKLEVEKIDRLLFYVDSIEALIASNKYNL